MNSHQKGTKGLAKAISYLTDIGYIVSIPLIDAQSYDLVYDDAKALQRLQVKYTEQINDSGFYIAGLTTTSYGAKGHSVKKFDPGLVDYLFIVTGHNTYYLIPSKEIVVSNSITLTKSRDKYIVRGKPYRKTINTCDECGKAISKRVTLCASCAAKRRNVYKTKIDWPSTESILKRLETTTFEGYARELGVTSNAIRKRIKNHPSS